MTDDEYDEAEEFYEDAVKDINSYLVDAKDSSERLRILSGLDYCVYCGGLKYEGRCYCLADD